MFYSHPELDPIIDKHRMQAENIIFSSGSKKLGEIFESDWPAISRNIVDVNTSSDILSIRPSVITSVISSWMREVELFLQQKQAEFNRIEEPTSDQSLEIQRLKTHIEGRVIVTYRVLEGKIQPLYEEFANTALAYISPLHQATNDMHQVYNEMNNIKGNFTGFENVSVYIHGIEDTGREFFDSAIEAAEDGDIIVFIDRNGDEQYYVVSTVNGVNKVSNEPLPFEQLEKTKQYKEQEGRLHIVYETEYANEHRQKTSDDLAEKFIEMGILNDETKIDMFAQSYGGRRSLQFAMDYPSHVRSVTTIGTPYDTNIPGKAANTFTGIAEKIGQNPSEFSYYLDFNSKNQRTDDGLTHSTAYTDMASEAMIDSIEQLQVANPLAYKELEKTMITAAVGRDTETRTYYSEFHGTDIEYEVEKSTDGLVATKSQRGDSLGSIVDEQPVFDVEGFGLEYPAHLYQIRNAEFIELIRSVNEEQKE